MLVLSRKESESITIGHNIKVVVLEYEGGQVRIGIEAPREVDIVRSELLHRKKDNVSYQSGMSKQNFVGRKILSLISNRKK